jgi:hypothetical protein
MVMMYFLKWPVFFMIFLSDNVCSWNEYIKLTNNQGRAIAQAVSRRLPAAMARI